MAIWFGENGLQFIQQPNEGQEPSVELLEFKRELDPTSAGAWCELIKDIVAFANSRRSYRFPCQQGRFFVQRKCGTDIRNDVADLANKIRRYADCDFSEIEITSIQRAGVSSFRGPRFQ